MLVAVPHFCPHCRAPFADAPDLAGQLVACPTCGQHVQLPRAVGGELIYGHESPQPPALPTFQLGQPATIIIASPPREHRLESPGWFARSFMSASGVLLAIGLAAALLCGGLIVLSDISSWGSRGDSGQEKIAKQQALVALKRHGITALGQEAVAGEVDGKWVVSGPAIDRGGRIAEVYVSFRVATTSGGRKWQLVDAVIDEQVVVANGMEN